jgi:hypothetical protein
MKLADIIFCAVLFVWTVTYLYVVHAAKKYRHQAEQWEGLYNEASASRERLSSNWSADTIRKSEIISMQAKKIERLESAYHRLEQWTRVISTLYAGSVRILEELEPKLQCRCPKTGRFAKKGSAK